MADTKLILILAISLLIIIVPYITKHYNNNLLQLFVDTKTNTSEKSDFIVSKKQKWYVITSGILVSCTYILSISYLIYMTYYITNMINTLTLDPVQLKDTALSLFDLYSSTRKIYLIGYTIVLILYAVITTYAYMITSNDCESQSIKYTSELWMGTNNNILNDLTWLWGTYIIVLIAKPIIISQGINILEQVYPALVPMITNT